MPDQYRAAPIDFIAQLQATVVPDSKARVVMNERTGTIVATSRVKVLSCAIAHGNIYPPSIRAQVSQPGPMAEVGDHDGSSRRGKCNRARRRPNVFPELPTVQEVSRPSTASVPHHGI